MEKQYKYLTLIFLNRSCCAKQ